MALYSYRCTSCAHPHESRRSMDDAAPRDNPPGKHSHRDAAPPCPECNAPSVRARIPDGLKIGAPGHFQNHIHLTGRAQYLKQDAFDLVRNRTKWNAT